MENKQKRDYYWMTKVGIHLIKDIDDFIVLYRIPKEDIKKVKRLWDKAIDDWESFQEYARQPLKSIKYFHNIRTKLLRKIPSYKLTSSITKTFKPHKKTTNRYRNARIVNRLQHFNIEQEEAIMNRYMKELNSQKIQKLSKISTT